MKLKFEHNSNVFLFFNIFFSLQIYMCIHTEIKLQNRPKTLDCHLSVLSDTPFNMSTTEKADSGCGGPEKEYLQKHKREWEKYFSCFYYLCLLRCENVYKVSHLAFSNKFRENVSTLYAEYFSNTITSQPLSAWSPSLNTKENACQVLKEIVHLHLKIH